MIAVCRQKTGSNCPYIFALAGGIARADSITTLQNEKKDDYSYWVQEVPEGSLVGDECDYHPIAVPKTRIIDHYALPGKGSPAKTIRAWAQIPAVGSLRTVYKPSVPSYSTIETVTMIHDPADYDALIIAEITAGMDVLLNGVLIASAPANKQLVTGKIKTLTQPERARFCRGVVWWLVNDPICLQDKLSEIGYVTPASIPAPVQIEDHLVEHITGSNLPGPGLIPVPDYDLYLESVVQKDMIDEGPDWPAYEGYFKDQEDSEIREYLSSIEPGPAIPVRSWTVPHLKLSIEEIPIAACAGGE